MKHIILSLLLVGAFTCEWVKTSFLDPKMIRCENEEVICYFAKKGYGGGMSCKFKETQK